MSFYNFEDDINLQELNNLDMGDSSFNKNFY